jgi:hypothetical protein
VIALFQTDEPSGDLRGWLILLIFILPALGRLLRKLAEKGAVTKRPEQPLERRPARDIELGEEQGDATIELERDGADAWERLLRGEEPREAPVLPAPAPVQRRSAEPLRSAEPIASAEGAPLGGLVELESLAPSALAEFAPAPASEESLERSGGDQVVSQFVDFSSELAGKELDALHAFEAEPVETAPARTFVPDDWRRAIIGAELLGAPIALRRHDSLAGVE